MSGCCNADTDAQISQTLLSPIASSSVLTDLFHFTKPKHPGGKLTWKKQTPFISSQFSAQAAGCIKSRLYFSALFCRSCGAPSLNCYDRSLTGKYFKCICLLAGIIILGSYCWCLLRQDFEPWTFKHGQTICATDMNDTTYHASYMYMMHDMWCHASYIYICTYIYIYLYVYTVYI